MPKNAEAAIPTDGLNLGDQRGSAKLQKEHINGHPARKFYWAIECCCLSKLKPVPALKYSQLKNTLKEKQ